MKILIICNRSAGLRTFRGMLIQTLIKRKHKIIAVVPSNHDDSELEAEKELQEMGCKLIRLPLERRGINPIKDLGLLCGYCKILKKVRPNFVITYTIKPGIYGGIACRLWRVPYVVNITGLGTAFQHSGTLRKLVIAMYKLALKNVTTVFFENTENQDAMIRFGIIDKSRTHVLPGAGVDLDRFQYTEYPKNDCRVQFIFIGRVMREKGVDELFAAMKRLYDEGFNCSLSILGSFEENYSERLEQYKKEGWLHYYGYQNDVRLFIEKSHCFVLPSWHEGMANTNLECAAMGRPIITSNIHGCMEAVIEGKTGLLCECKDADSLYQVMRQFIEMPYEKKKQMGVAGKVHMETVFDKKKVVEETIKKIKLEL